MRHTLTIILDHYILSVCEWKRHPPTQRDNTCDIIPLHTPSALQSSIHLLNMLHASVVGKKQCFSKTTKQKQSTWPHFVSLALAAEATDAAHIALLARRYRQFEWCCHRRKHDDSAHCRSSKTILVQHHETSPSNAHEVCLKRPMKGEFRIVW